MKNDQIGMPLEFDFDEWQRLAASDPQAFAHRRAEFIAAQIARFPAGRRERLERFQWRLDAECRRATTPLSACLGLSRKMWDSFYRMGDQMHRLFKPSAPRQGQPRGSLIPFPKTPPDK